MGKMKSSRAVTLRAISERLAREIRPLVRELVQVEHDAMGLSVQASRAGFNKTGIDEVLERLWRGVDKRFAAAVGIAPKADSASAIEAREILDLIGRFLSRFNVDADTAQLPQNFVVWADRPELYDEMPRPDGGRRTVPRYELAGITSKDLRPDGQLRRRLPESSED